MKPPVSASRMHMHIPKACVVDAPFYRDFPDNMVIWRIRVSYKSKQHGGALFRRAASISETQAEHLCVDISDLASNIVEMRTQYVLLCP